jgi:hypothetical protein
MLVSPQISKHGLSRISQKKGISIQRIQGLTNLGLQDARAVEQTLIDTYGLGKMEERCSTKHTVFRHSQIHRIIWIRSSEDKNC